MAQKKEDLELLIDKEFSKFSFYNKKDELSITKQENDTYFIDYYAINKKPHEDDNAYINCTIELNTKEKYAIWNYIWIEEEHRGKGWGGKIIKNLEKTFKKIGIEITYVNNNINPGFWTRMGYPVNIKLLKKKPKAQNMYHHAYQLIEDLGLKNETANLVVNNYNENIFDLSYSYDADKHKDKELGFDMRIDLKEKTAILRDVHAKKDEQKLLEKCEDLLRKLGVKEIQVDRYYYSGEDNIWENANYLRNEDNIWYKKL